MFLICIFMHIYKLRHFVWTLVLYVQLYFKRWTQRFFFLRLTSWERKCGVSLSPVLQYEGHRSVRTNPDWQGRDEGRWPLALPVPSTIQPTHTAQNAQQPATRQHLLIRMAPAGYCPLHSTPGTQNSQNGQVAQPISGSEPAEPELMPSSLTRLQWTAAISYRLLARATCHLDKWEEGGGSCPGLGATLYHQNSLE